MSANDLLYLLVGAALIGLYFGRPLLRDNWSSYLRLLLFMCVSSFWFDYVANDRTIWWFRGEWELMLLLNPLENSLFTAAMTTLFLVGYLLLERCIAKRSR